MYKATASPGRLPWGRNNPGSRSGLSIMTEAFIQLMNISHAYREGERSHRVLSDVSLTLERGEKAALLGRSGSGKSTLLNLVSGIDMPDNGKIIVAGRQLTELGEAERTRFRRRHIGFIYQFFNLVPGLTAKENIALMLELNNFDSEVIARETEAMLEKVGLQDRADKFPDQLSGGEQQRVAFARALIHHPVLILADEPTGNLDARTGEIMLKLLDDLLQEEGGTMLLVTHSLAVAEMADRILTLEDGRVEERKGDFAW